VAENREELLAHYRQTRQDLLAAIDGLSDELMAEASIDGWSVKDHLLHLALWDDIRADEVERISAGHESAWQMTDEQDEALNEMGYEIRRNLSVQQARAESERSRRRLLDAIAAATPRALEPSRYGAAGLRSGHEEEHTEWLVRWRGERGV